MRIMYLTQWFEPEPNIIKGLPFVRALQAAGHEVTVVTGLPNYPAGRLYPGYRVRPIQQEIVGGVRIVRLPLYASHDGSSLRRSLNFLSFFGSALLYSLFRRERFDLAYVYHPPITVGLAAALAGRVRGLPFVLDVQDLWPDTLAATGMPGASRLAGLLGPVCAFVYRRAAAVIVQSDGMREALVRRGAAAAKITTVRNWSDLELATPGRPTWRPRAERFTLVYGGNLGLAQGLETVVEAAAILRRRAAPVEVVLYGDGLRADALRAQAARLGADNLRFEARVGRDQIVRAFARADALLLHLADRPLFEITIPSKTQAYLAMGRPIVAAVSGEAAELLRRSGAALVCAPGDADALARSIAELAATPRGRRERMGRRGRAFYREHLAFGRGLDQTLGVLEGIYGGHPPSRRAAAP